MKKMNKTMFYNSDGKLINDLKSYVTSYLEKNPDVRVYIGTDSKRRKKKFKYITTICFRHPGNGVHIIHSTIIFKIEEIGKDIFNKLWKEVEITVDVLNDVLQFVDKTKITVDLDYNVVQKHKSNAVHDSAKGWVIGLGVDVRTKPNAWAASHAADYLSNR